MHNHFAVQQVRQGRHLPELLTVAVYSHNGFFLPSHCGCRVGSKAEITERHTFFPHLLAQAA